MTGGREFVTVIESEAVFDRRPPHNIPPESEIRAETR